MTPANHREASPTIGHEAAEAMAKYGITRVPTDYFHYKEHRYTSLDDAIAQAKRQHPSVPSDGRERSGSR
jgi:acetyl-CoA acetyltransferase